MSANEHDDDQPDSFEVIERLRARVVALEAALKAAYHALESYAHGNGSPELAVSVAAHCKAILKDAPQ